MNALRFSQLRVAARSSPGGGRSGPDVAILLNISPRAGHGGSFFRRYVSSESITIIVFAAVFRTHS